MQLEDVCLAIKHAKLVWDQTIINVEVALLNMGFIWIIYVCHATMIYVKIAQKDIKYVLFVRISLLWPWEGALCANSLAKIATQPQHHAQVVLMPFL